MCVNINMIKFNKYNTNVFNFLIEKKKVILPKKNDNEINNIYQYIFYAIHNSVNLVNNSKLFYNKKVIQSYNHGELINSSFVPSKIKSYIINSSNTINITSKYNINNKEFNINLFSYKDISNKKIESYLKNINILIIFLLKIQDHICLEDLTIYIYLTPFKKLLPKKKGCILEPYHINTGVTRPCQKSSEIVIYREEEWFKLLVHESLHVFGIDFSLIDNLTNKELLKELFYIKSSFLINETYCETCARLINAAFVSYYKINNFKNIKNINDKVNKFNIVYSKLINIERFYSIHQMNIILNYYNINYKDLISNNIQTKNIVCNKYGEKTNVFCYYVLTAILLNNYLDFFKWCNTNNNYIFNFYKEKKNIDLFIDLIISNHNNKELFGIIDCLNELDLNNKSLKMSCLSL